MDQNLSTEQKNFFSAIITSPEQIGPEHVDKLNLLVGQYPHSGILRALLASASQSVNAGEFQQKLKSAAVYAPDRTALYNLINYPEKLLKPGDEFVPVTNIDEIPDETEEHDDIYEEITPIEDIIYKSAPKPQTEPAPAAQEEETETIAEPQTYSIAEPQAFIKPQPDKETAPADFDKGNLEDVIFAQYAWAKDADIEADDILTIIQPLPTEEKKTPNQTESDTSTIEIALDKQPEIIESPEKKNEFKFEIAGSESITENDTTDLTVNPVNTESTKVSRYDDDKLPYTFLWWLDKTRKEHAGSHQPYIPFKPVTQAVATIAANLPEELQQQYYENIFHVTTVEELEKNNIKPEVTAQYKHKDDAIIERFIQEDPQIKPPTGEKLDNENKARRSAEDTGELVSETLARIYLDQMLYHKAISTYQKLLLKFPEKSSYFVAQIKLLEKKIN